MIRHKYWETKELAAKLKEILEAEGIPVSARTGQAGVQLIPVERWKFLIVLAAEQEWLDRVQYWVALLDVPETRDDRQYFIYTPENSRSVELLETMENIMGLSQEQPDQDPSENFNETLVQSASNEPPSAAASKTTEPSTFEALSAVSQNIALAVDETRNALVIYASPTQYQAMESLLKRLDVMPPQVLIEATVAEVTLTDSLQYGLEWYLKNETSGIVDGGADSQASTVGGLGLGTAGLAYSLVSRADRFKVLINAMAEEELVKVLSSPRITVRDGKSATITVGTQVPVVTSEQAATDSDNIVRTYQYRTTGVTLKVTPVVHARDIVTLEINQDVSEAAASGGENPLILNRTINTEVVAAAGQAVVIGGLIKDSNGLSKSKVPFFGDLPLIGKLFSAQNQGGERTELVVMITPHILRSSQQIEDIRQAIFDTFTHLE